MRIEFDDKDHIYTVDGEIASISTTELLHKHGLAPSYKGVSKAKMKAAAEEGRAVHKDLENVLNEAGYEPTTEQGKQWKAWVKENVECGVGEQMLGYNYKGMIIAGTADVMGFLKDGQRFIADHKNTAKFNREYVSWQVSINDYMARQLGREKINDKLLNWKGASYFTCNQFDKKTGEMTVYELEKIPDSEIERLFECEYNNEKYKRPVLVIDPELQLAFEAAEEEFALAEEAYKNAVAKRDDFREKLLTLFEEQGIKSWESKTGRIRVSYVEPSEQLRIDSQRLKKERPDIFTAYQKLTKVKSQIRVKIREKDEDGNYVDY